MALTRHMHGDLLEALDEALEFLDNYVDVVDGDYGQPRPNRAMKLHTRLVQERDRLEREATRPDYIESHQALFALLSARCTNGDQLEGNPYLNPFIKRGLKAVAKVRGIESYLDALGPWSSETDTAKMTPIAPAFTEKHKQQRVARVLQAAQKRLHEGCQFCCAKHEDEDIDKVAQAVVYAIEEQV